MRHDPLRDKIFYIISHSPEPITVNGIYLALRDKKVSRNAIVSRLVQLNIMGRVNRGISTINGKQFYVYRKKVN